MTEKKLSPEQEEAVYFPKSVRGGLAETHFSHLVIEAGAGAGKTTLLTERVAWRLLGSDKRYRINPQDMILVTFSRAAEEELSSRIERRLRQEKLPEDQLDKILGRLHISTIDSLFTQLSNNLFPTWWEQQRLRLPEQTLKNWGLVEQRFPPAVTLVSEDELRPELSECVLQYVQSSALDADREIPLLDFILAGAFESKSYQGHTSSRYAGLQRITAAMLHESLLRSDAPPLRFALDTIHPMAAHALEAIRELARQQFYRRLMHGRMTHNDRMLLLYQLLVAPAAANATDSFWSTVHQPLPVQCKELIVDEYQDTNELQHVILSALLEPTVGRMVVVGDPKQSIYGFRSAHVGVFQSLKADPQWKNIELTKNFRSHPELLPWINYLSELTFAYRNNKIPDEFLRTEFSQNAQKTYVGSKALDIGRSDLDGSTHTQRAPHPRLMLLGASLSKERSSNGLPLNAPSLHTFTTWAIARELKALIQSKHYNWKDVVILCETNDWTIRTQSDLQELGIPAIAKTSRSVGSDSIFRERCETIGMILAKWLAGPIEIFEFAQLIWNGWFQLTHEQASELISAASCGALDSNVINGQFNPSITSDISQAPELYHEIFNHLKKSRSLAAIHFFSGWQALRWGFDETITPQRNVMNLEMENFAVSLQNVLEAWTVRKQLEEAAERLMNATTTEALPTFSATNLSPSVWPSELIQSTLNQVRIQSTATDTTQDAVTVCTIHGAKGLEWPVVVFWPNSKRDLPAENFVMKSGVHATQVKWLAEDNQSASLLPWVQNPHPPTDTVAVLTEGHKGETAQLWSADLQDKLEQDFERQRVFYTAYTRAREMLILVSPGVSGRAQKSLRDKLAPLKVGDELAPVQLKLTGLESNVMAVFADQFFNLRKQAKRGSRPERPWTGKDLEAQVAQPQYEHLLALKDYGPDWLEDFLTRETDLNKPQNDQTQFLLNENWYEAWAHERINTNPTSPWLKQIPSAQSPQEKQDSVPETKNVSSTGEEHLNQRIESPVEQPLSPSELGLRFHALMEHSQPTATRSSTFMNRFLKTALIREHELELWGDFETEQTRFYQSQSLVRTQRKILDVFCVIPAARWPKALQNAQAIKPVSDALQSIQDLLETAASAEGWIHVVIDFKTGSPKQEHVEQMSLYLNWVRNILSTHPELLVGAMTSNALFAAQDKPLVGILCYTGQIEKSLPHKFRQCLRTVDKNTSLLFVSTE